jgi:hypothetical protein
MQKLYEAPELSLIGQADEVIMGSGTPGIDLPHQGAPDFEFEQD